jgi:tRNA modification GTPase
MLLETEDTITAIATPYGRAALGTIRISGRNAFTILSRIFTPRSDKAVAPYHPTVGKIRARSHEIDEAMAIYFQHPHSYTREDLVEITCHGNPLILDQVLKGILDEGARLAYPGEFTYRAFLNGRIDLVQASAVNDLISADSLYQAELALQHLKGKFSERLGQIRTAFIELISLLEGNIDFSEEQHYHFIDQETAIRQVEELRLRILEMLGTFERGRLIREGFSIALVGRPNVGKSSIFNSLLGESRAIVTPVAGTTRDYIRERITIGNFLVQLLDTAGIRESKEQIELEGIRRTRQVIEIADLVLFVLDGSEAPNEEDERLWQETEGKVRFVICNKSDLPLFERRSWHNQELLSVSAVTRSGIDDLLKTIENHIQERTQFSGENFLVSNLRHRDALEKALLAVERSRESLLENRSEEFAMVDLHHALQRIGEITGEVTIDEIYQHIFSNFCIGK